MATFKNYDPDRVVLALFGIPITGYADGTFINVERDTETFTKSIGAQGDVVRVRSRDKSGTITVTLMSSSPANDLLSARMILDEETGLGYGPALVKELNGTTLVKAGNAWIEKPPSVEYGKEDGTREWKIVCANLEMFVGGLVV